MFVNQSWAFRFNRSIAELCLIARDAYRSDKELSQALWRVPSSLFGAAYLIYAVRNGMAGSSAAIDLVPVIAIGHVVFSIALIAVILRQPNSAIRPIVTVLIDLGAFGVFLALSGPWIAPLMLLHMLIVTTFGIRFGLAPMALAQTVAVMSLAIMWATDQAWAGQELLVLTWAGAILFFPTWVVQLLRDMSDRKRQLHRRALAGTKLLSQASHDIRHPLHAAAIFTARLGQTGLDQDQGQLLSNLEQSLTSAGEMLQAYLDLSLVESGQLAIRRQSVPVQAIFDELRLQFLGAADRAEVELKFVPTKQIVDTDRVMLRTILQNLVTNAIRHAPGTKLVIGCRLQAKGLAIQVSDRGSREGCTGDTGGTESPRNSGLGMSIVYGLSREMNLGVKQVQVDRGYHVLLSGLTPSEVRPDDKSLHERHAAFRPLAGMKVYLVSANDSARGDEEILFRSWGCDVLSARRVDEGSRSCDVAVIHIEQIDARASTLLRRMKMPAIVIAPDATALPRWLPSTMIKARQPMNPAQVRSMMMALR